MNSWGYIGVGLACGLIAGIVFAIAGPSATDLALGKPAGGDGGLMFLGYVFAAVSSVLTLIGIIAQGVRVASRA